MTTPQLPPLPDERAKFEDWYEQRHGNKASRSPSCSNSYRSYTATVAWAAWRAALSASPVAESIHAENARTLQELVDELREMLGVKDGESLTASVRFLQEDIRSIATELARLTRDYYGDPA